MRRAFRWIAPCLLAAPVAADVLVLVDGRVVEERELARAEGGIEVRFPSGTVLVPDALVHLALIEGEPDPAPRDDAEREKYAKGLVPLEGEWVPRKRRDELLARRVAARKAEIADNLAHCEWKDRRRAETKNFRFEYTVPQHVFEGYRDRMEAYYQVFAKEWRIKPPEAGKLSVCFYASPKEFYRTSGADYGVLAYFRFVEPYDLNLFYERLDPTLTEQVLYHEANHYLQKLIDETFSYPHWPGEALAEFYGASLWDPAKQKLTVGLLQEGRLAEIQDDIARGEWMGLGRLIGEELYEHYTWGWSLVYFLMNDPRHQDAFKRFFLGLAGGRDVKRTPMAFGLMTVEPPDVATAFRKYLRVESAKAFAELERDWHRHVEEQLGALSTRGLELAAVKALSTGRKLRAKRLFEEAIAAGSKNPQLFHKYALLLEKDERGKALEMARRTVELDPLTGSYWFALGHLLEKQDRAEAERLKKLAREIDPELGTDSIAWDF